MSLQTEFEAAHLRRGPVLDRMRANAAFTIPFTLPDDLFSGNDEIHQSYQSLGANGISNLVAKLLTALFPPGMPWFLNEPSAKAKMVLGDDAFLEMENLLYRRDLAIQRKFEAMGHRIPIRAALQSILILGPALMLVTDKYRLRGFRIDQYVLKRASDSELLWLITHEKKDIEQLSEEDRAKAEINKDQISEDSNGGKTVDLYTKAARQRSDKWIVQQEINNKIIRTSEEPVNPYLAPGYIELPGEDYSRSFVEERSIGDLRAYNGLSKAILDGMVNAAKMVPVLDDANSNGMSPADLAKPNGQVVYGRVQNGQVQGAAFLKTDKFADFSVAIKGNENIETRIGKQMLLEMDAQPTGDRVTATQVSRIARELDGALGGIYAHIAEEIQRPLYDRVVYQMERDKILTPLPEEIADATDTHILTGLEALARQSRLDRLAQVVQMIAPMPDAQRRIKWATVYEDVFKGVNLDVHRYLMTEDELSAEAQAQIEQQVQLAAAQQSIATAGKVVESAAQSS